MEFFHHQHAASAQFVDGAWNDDRFGVVAKHAGEVFEVLSFTAEIQFASDHGCKLADHLGRPPSSERFDSFGQLSQAAQHFDVLLDYFFDTRTLDF